VVINRLFLKNSESALNARPDAIPGGNNVRSSRTFNLVLAPLAVAALFFTSLSVSALANTKLQDSKELMAAVGAVEADRLDAASALAETNEDLALARAISQTTRSLVREQRTLTAMAKKEAKARAAEMARLAKERLLRTSAALKFRIYIPSNVDIPSSFSGVKRNPLPGTRISAYFGQRGWRWDGGIHTGTDFDGYYGQSVKAAADGVVVGRGWDGSYGYSILIAHGDGVTTRYAHLSDIDISLGDRVSIGQHIGNVGSTGNSSGSHLHFEVALGDRLVDPLDWLRS
jgi:murein DD-endopeptidase MepM/ murein hydrolase activator NlpD